MTSVEYDLDSNGGLMPQILALTAPPGSRDRTESNAAVVATAEASSSLSAHPYFKRPGRGHNRDCCDACGEGGDLICCDICPASFHLICHDPPLFEEDIPLGEWGCHQCKVTQGDDCSSGTGRNNSNGSSSKHNRGVKRKERDDDKSYTKTDVKSSIIINNNNNNNNNNSSSPSSVKPSDSKTLLGNGSNTSKNISSDSKLSNSSGSCDGGASSSSDGSSVGAGVLKVMVSGREMELTDTPFLPLVRQAVITNPKQFALPYNYSVPIAFPGESKAPLRINGRRVASSKRKPSHEKDNGLVPLPAKLCFTCNKSCRVGPLLACDYCPLLFHLDCLDPPLTTAPTHRWMCPNHPEHFLDQHMLTSCRVTERVRLWERCRGLIDQAVVQRSFFNRCHRPNPLRRFKLNKVLRSTIRVPEAIKEAYRNRSEKLPPLPPSHLRALSSPELPPEYLASLNKMSSNNMKCSSPSPYKSAETDENSVSVDGSSKNSSEESDRDCIDTGMDCPGRLSPSQSFSKAANKELTNKMTVKASVTTASKGACCDKNDQGLSSTGPDSNALTPVPKKTSELGRATSSERLNQVNNDKEKSRSPDDRYHMTKAGFNHKHDINDELEQDSVLLHRKPESPSSMTPSDVEGDTTEDETLMHSPTQPSTDLTTRVGGQNTAPPPSSRGNFRGGGGGGGGCHKSSLDADIDELTSRRMMGGISAMAVAAMALMAEGNNKGDTTSDESEGRTDDEEADDTARRAVETKTDEGETKARNSDGRRDGVNCERRKRKKSDHSVERSDLSNEVDDDIVEMNKTRRQVESTAARKERTDGDQERNAGEGLRKRFKSGSDGDEDLAWTKECTVKQCELEGEKTAMESILYKRALNVEICQSNGDIMGDSNWDSHQGDSIERFENNNKILSKNNEKSVAKLRLLSSDSAEEELMITRDGEPGGESITKGSMAHSQSTPLHNSSNEGMDITSVGPISPVTSGDGRLEYNLGEVYRPLESKTAGSVSPSSTATSSLEDSTMSGDCSGIFNVTVIDTLNKTDANTALTTTISTTVSTTACQATSEPLSSTTTTTCSSSSSMSTNQRTVSVESNKSVEEKLVTNCTAIGSVASVTKFTVIGGPSATLKHPSISAFTEVAGSLNPDWPSPIMDISDDSSASERLFVQEDGSEVSSLKARRPSAEVFGRGTSPLASGTSVASATPGSQSGGGSRCTVYATHIANPGTILYHSTNHNNNNNLNNMIHNDYGNKQNRTQFTTSNKTFTVLNRTYSNNHVMPNTFHPNNVSFSKPNQFVANCPQTFSPVIPKPISSIQSTESAPCYYNAQYNAVAQIGNSNNQQPNEVCVNQTTTLSGVQSMSSNCNRQYRPITNATVQPPSFHGSHQQHQSQYQHATSYSSNTTGGGSNSNNNWGQPWSSFCNNKQTPSAVYTHYSSSVSLPPTSQENCSVGVTPPSFIQVTEIKPEPSDRNLASCSAASHHPIADDTDDDFKPSLPTDEEKNAWLSSLVSFQASVAKHMMKPELPSTPVKTVPIPLPTTFSQSTRASAASSTRKRGSTDQETTVLPTTHCQQSSRNPLTLPKPSLSHQTASSSLSLRPITSSPPPAPPPPPLPSMRSGRKQVLIPRISPTGSCSQFLTSPSASVGAGMSKPAAPPRTPAKSYLARSSTLSSAVPTPSSESNAASLSELLLETLQSLQSKLHTSYASSKCSEVLSADRNLMELLAMQRLEQLLRPPPPPPAPLYATPSLPSHALLCPLIEPISELQHWLDEVPYPSTPTPAVPMQYRQLSVGKGSHNDVDLDKFGRCNYISNDHACILFDEYAGQYELLSYSRHGTEVDGGVYRCDVSADRSSLAQPPPTSLQQQVRDLVHKHRDSYNKHGAPGYDFTLKDEPTSKRFKKEPLGAAAAVVASPLEGKPAMTKKADQEVFRCGCPRKSVRDAASRAGWEGPAILRHGSFLRFGCIKFVFSIVETASKGNWHTVAEEAYDKFYQEELKRKQREEEEKAASAAAAVAAAAAAAAALAAEKPSRHKDREGAKGGSKNNKEKVSKDKEQADLKEEKDGCHEKEKSTKDTKKSKKEKESKSSKS